MQRQTTTRNMHLPVDIVRQVPKIEKFIRRNISKSRISVSCFRPNLQPNYHQRHTHLYPRASTKTTQSTRPFRSTKPAQFSYSRYRDYLLATVQESFLLSRFLAAFVNPRLRNQSAIAFQLGSRTILFSFDPPSFLFVNFTLPYSSFHSQGLLR